MIRLVLATLLAAPVLAGCGGHAEAKPPACASYGGGRCAEDVAWSGPIYLTRNGMRLHQVIICGGTLHASETADKVYLRLHLGEMGPGSMSCAKVDVGVRLAQPLGHRTVVDSVGHRAVHVSQGRPPDHLVR